MTKVQLFKAWSSNLETGNLKDYEKNSFLKQL